MRNRPSHADKASASPDALSTDYQQRLHEALQVAVRYNATRDGGARRLMARELDEAFSQRIEILRRLPEFPTLDAAMPNLQAIQDRAATAAAEQVATTFAFRRDRPANEQLIAATALHAHAAGIRPHGPPFTEAEADTFVAARTSVLRQLGCTFPFPPLRAQYSNMLSFVHADCVIRLVHEPLATPKGLPHAWRIAELTLLSYVDGQARTHIATFAKGRWDSRVTADPQQRTIDMIAAAIG